MRLAVTGGIAEGKSTVLQVIQEAGVEVASADEIAKRVFELDEVQAGLARILGGEPPVEPGRLKSAIFANPPARRAVNRLMHPLVIHGIEASQAPVVEVPLLLESATQGLFDRVWVVTCGPEEQLRRLIERTGDPLQAKQILEAQLPSRARLPFADRIVRTNLEPNTVRQYVFEAIGLDLGTRIARS